MDFESLCLVFDLEPLDLSTMTTHPKKKPGSHVQTGRLLPRHRLGLD
jgi:hypothetical protein